MLDMISKEHQIGETVMDKQSLEVLSAVHFGKEALYFIFWFRTILKNMKNYFLIILKASFGRIRAASTSSLSSSHKKLASFILF